MGTGHLFKATHFFNKLGSTEIKYSLGQSRRINLLAATKRYCFDLAAHCCYLESYHRVGIRL